MFDIVGKRNWFFAFSLLITIPGLIFILLTPLSNGAAGLKFSIDYTGGTEWSIRFADTNVTADQVRQEWARKPSLYGLRDDEFMALGATRPSSRREARSRV